MKRFAKTSRLLIVAAAFLMTTMSAHAGNKLTDVAGLRAAYSTLLGANHNYSNHRLLAMQAIQRAGSLLGANINGADGKGGELQILSDIQLHQAQFTLQMVRTGIAKGQQPQVAAQLDIAINQIGLALTVN